jgi:type I restriction enzyme S subunit
MAGSCLLHKISYGAVQPQIGQDELLRLPIPRQVLDYSNEILERMNQLEMATRAAHRLTAAAKLLVEALIEGKLSESELKEAQEALERGEREADRAILARLTRKGIDVAGEAPLFPDLDVLYDAIDQTATPREEAAAA